jgi:hypothetical protein
VLVRRGARHDAPVREHDLGFHEPVVDEAVAEAVRLDADADGGTADRDVLQFRRDEGSEAMRQGVVDDGFERGETFHLQRAGLRVQLQDVIEAAQVQLRPRPGSRCVAEQVRARAFPDTDLAAAPGKLPRQAVPARGKAVRGVQDGLFAAA